MRLEHNLELYKTCASTYKLNSDYLRFDYYVLTLLCKFNSDYLRFDYSVLTLLCALIFSNIEIYIFTYLLFSNKRVNSMY